MEVCPNCFESHHLRDHIQSEGDAGDCPTCGTERTRIIRAGALMELFEPLSKYYEIAEPGQHYIYDPEEGGPIGGNGGEPLDELLQAEWPIFSDKVDPDDIPRILAEVWPDFDNTSNYASGDLWYTSPDEEFQSLAERLMHERRFFPKQHAPEPGILSIDQLLKHRLDGYARDVAQTEWFRARRQDLVSLHAVPRPLTACEVGAPPMECVLRGGRASPAGISYLYLGSSVETVIAETRAIPGDYLSVGTFAVPVDLLVLDLAAAVPPVDPFANDDLRREIEQGSLLRELGWRLSRPIRDGEHELGYVVTQYLAEFVASEGYAGIIYPSAVSKGVNLVLFDPAVAKCTGVCQYKVNTLDLTYGFRPVSNCDRDRARYV